MNTIFDCRWTIRHFRKGQLIWEIVDKKNILVDEGEKAILDTFFRNRASIYFPSTNFYIGAYNGTIAEATVLATIPNEPAVANGYSRQVIERSTVGWPTIAKHEGDWRITSKAIVLSAVGGTIGPISGSFLCTSADNTGTLISSLSWNVERTVAVGDSITLQPKVKLK